MEDILHDEHIRYLPSSFRQRVVMGAMQVHGLEAGLILTYLQEETITQDDFTIRVLPA